MQGCTGKLRITYSDKVVMGNFVDHLWCVHNGAFLTYADFNGRKDGKEGQVVVVAQKRRKGAPEPEQLVKLTPAQISWSISSPRVAGWYRIVSKTTRCTLVGTSVDRNTAT